MNVLEICYRLLREEFVVFIDLLQDDAHGGRGRIGGRNAANRRNIDMRQAETAATASGNLGLSKSYMKFSKKVNFMDSRIFSHKKENGNSYKFSFEEKHRKYRVQSP